MIPEGVHHMLHLVAYIGVEDVLGQLELHVAILRCCVLGIRGADIVVTSP